MAKHANDLYRVRPYSILPRLSIRRMTVWFEMYCRWDPWIGKQIRREDDGVPPIFEHGPKEEEATEGTEDD
jgi:hypothetical protein